MSAPRIDCAPTAVPLWESEAFAALAGGCRHPGGLGLTERAFELCPLPRGSSVLDVGCGDGVTVEHLQRRYGLRVTGIDRSAALLDEGRRRRPGLDLREAAAEHLPFAAAAFDAVLAECVLSIVAEPALVAGECARVLRPGGLLMLNDVCRRDDPYAVRRLLDGLGFDVVAWEDHSGALARLVWEIVERYGSLAAFRRAAGVAGPPASSGGGGGLGYIVCVARRRELASEKGREAR